MNFYRFPDFIYKIIPIEILTYLSRRLEDSKINSLNLNNKYKYNKMNQKKKKLKMVQER